MVVGQTKGEHVDVLTDDLHACAVLAQLILDDHLPGCGHGAFQLRAALNGFELALNHARAVVEAQVGQPGPFLDLCICHGALWPWYQTIMGF